MGRHDVEMTGAEQRAAVSLARELATEFDRLGGDADRANALPAELVALYRESGLCGLVVPKRYGGMGADIWTATRVSRELAKGDPACALAFNMHTTMVGIFRRLLPADQRAWLFPELVTGRKLVCGPFSEERAGLTGLADTTAAPVDDGFRIDGRKTWATLCEVADYIAFNATVTDDAEGLLPADFQRHVEQECVFLLPMTAPGISIDKTWDTLGMRATGTETVVFDGVHAPATALCGSFRGGLFDEFEWPAMTFSGVYQGLTEKAYDETAEILRKKSLGATPAGPDVLLKGLGYVQSGLGRMLVETTANARLLEMSCRQLLEGVDADWSPAARVALLEVCKVMVTEGASKIVSDGMRLVGGSAYRRGHLLERLFRDARSGPFHPLTTDQVYDILGRWELGLLEPPDLPDLP